MTARIAAAPRGGTGWQLILADLALILFLLALSALPAAEAESGRRLADSGARGEEARRAEDTARAPELAAAQALYRPVPGGPSLGEWLADQPRDPRMTVSVVALHPQGGEAEAWAAAQRLAREADGAGVKLRIVIAPGSRSEIYASLGFDAAPG